MTSCLAMLLYIDHKCATQPGFRKPFLVLTLIFVFLLRSPRHPLLCPYSAFVVLLLCGLIRPPSLSLNVLG
jgi:hypothetical protein